MGAVYKETQQFRQWWIWLLLSPLIVVTLYIVFAQLVMGNPVGDNPLPDWGVMVFAVFALCIISFIWFLRLETRIDRSGIHMNYKPVLKRESSWNEIDRVELVDYGFVGYGFRWWPKHGWIYNVAGSKGLKIYLRSGKHFVIGTQKKDELEAYLEKSNINYSSATS